MAIWEPTEYATEEILRIPITGKKRCFVVSGYADFSSLGEGDGNPAFSKIHGDPDNDNLYVTHQLHMVVGPEFHNVDDVSPIASVAGYSFMGSDETDSTGVIVENCKWDTVQGSSTSVERVRLKVKLRMCGGKKSMVSKIAYHFTVIGDIFSAVG